MNDTPVHETPKSSTDDESNFQAAVFDTAVRHCFDKLDYLVARLHRYPLDAIGTAMSVYLVGLLECLLDEQACTVGEVREFLHNMELEILQSRDRVSEE